MTKLLPKKNTGYALAEIVASVAVIAILASISTWYLSAKNMQAEAEEGYIFATNVADRVVEYYGANGGSYPGSGTYNYGTNPGEYVASVEYFAPTSADVNTYAYVQTTFKNEVGGDPSSGVALPLQGQWIILRLSVSGDYLVKNCYTNIASSYMSGEVVANGKNAPMVGHSCEVQSNIANVINMT